MGAGNSYSASFTDAATSGIQNSGNNAVSNYGGNLPAYPFGGLKNSAAQVLNDAESNPLIFAGIGVALFVVFALVVGSKR